MDLYFNDCEKNLFNRSYTKQFTSTIVDKIQVAIFVEFYDKFYCTYISQGTPDTEYTRQIGSSL